MALQIEFTPIPSPTITVEEEDGALDTVFLDQVIRGEDGEDGADGQDGADGLSAYEIAVLHGFIGTEEQWLASLQGGGGGSGQNDYLHQQLAAAPVWIVDHNLGKRPSVSVSDSAGNKGEGTVFYDNLNRLTITFRGSMGGEAYCI